MYLGVRGLGFLIHDTTTDLSPGTFARCEHFIRDRSGGQTGLDAVFAPLATVEAKVWSLHQPRWDFRANPRGGCGEW
jgi:hypothetical protein